MIAQSTTCQLLRERIEQANLRRKKTTKEAKRLAKLEANAYKLKRGENVQIANYRLGYQMMSTQQ